MIAQETARPAGWVHHPNRPVIGRLDHVVALGGSGEAPDELHLVCSDHGLFRKLHELPVRAGENARWASFRRPEQAYQFGLRRGPGDYAPDTVRAATAERVMAFLNT